MKNNLELIQELIQQSEQITRSNEERDAVIKRAEMLFRKIFGSETHYLKSLKEIGFTPGLSHAFSSDSTFEISFNRGKKELLNLLNVVAEDIQLEQAINFSNYNGQKNAFNSNNVFIVHGHNVEMKLAAARTIEKLKLNPIILHDQQNKGKTIIEKFTDNSEVAFAIVLLSADDIAYNKNETVKSKKFRPRQNVIFELGFFIGKLGRERVFVLHEIEKELDIPSDYKGVIFVEYDKAGKWKFDLVKELKGLNIPVDANDLLK